MKDPVAQMRRNFDLYPREYFEQSKDVEICREIGQLIYDARRTFS